MLIKIHQSLILQR